MAFYRKGLPTFTPEKRQAMKQVCMNMKSVAAKKCRALWSISERRNDILLIRYTQTLGDQQELPTSRKWEKLEKSVPDIRNSM